MIIKKDGVKINLTESDIRKLNKTLLKEQKVSKIIQKVDEDICLILCKIKIASVGSRGPIVKAIQNALYKIVGDWGGYNPQIEGKSGYGGGMSPDCGSDLKTCDGIFKKFTKAAVKLFQEDYNKRKNGSLKPDGIVGFNTLTALCDVGLIDCPQCACVDVKKQYESTRKKDDQTSGGGGSKKTRGSGFDALDCDVIKKCLKAALTAKERDIIAPTALYKLKDCIGITDEMLNPTTTDPSGGVTLTELPEGWKKEFDCILEYSDKGLWYQEGKSWYFVFTESSRNKYYDNGRMWHVIDGVTYPYRCDGGDIAYTRTKAK